jgi:ubiquinone/menaquinone biosynthesis C-methylase UbiE
MAEEQQARYASNVEIAHELLTLEGRSVLDVGCGEGRFTRILAAKAADTTGIDINRESLDRAQAITKEEGLKVTWINAHAEDMPFDDARFNVVVFSNSLHHVARSMMDRAIEEAGRVLITGGLLYAMEPVAEGIYFEATRMVNDERAVRDLAKAAIDHAAGAQFEPLTEVTYRAKRVFESFEEWRDDQSRRSEKRRKIFEANETAIRASFLNGAREEDGKLCFDQLFRVNLLSKSG